MPTVGEMIFRTDRPLAASSLHFIILYTCYLYHQKLLIEVSFCTVPLVQCFPFYS